VQSVLGGEEPDFAHGLKFLMDSDAIKGALGAANRMSAVSGDLESLVSDLKSLQSKLQSAMETLSSEGGCEVDLESVLGTLTAPLEAFGSCASAVMSLEGVEFGGQLAGVASYNRWVEVDLQLPCSRMKTADFEVAGIKATSVDYPEFYACSWAKKVPLPNEHIPYLRLPKLALGGSGCPAP
jgi:hypothetical protein